MLDLGYLRKHAPVPMTPAQELSIWRYNQWNKWMNEEVDFIYCSVHIQALNKEDFSPQEAIIVPDGGIIYGPLPEGNLNPQLVLLLTGIFPKEDEK